MFWKKYRGKIMLGLGLGVVLVPMIILLAKWFIEDRNSCLLFIGIILWAFGGAGLIAYGSSHLDE